MTSEIETTARWASSPAGPGLRPLDTVFVGGGTPTVLDADQLAGILSSLRRGFGLADNAEITLEANPGTVDAAGLLTCRQAGFNRISFGLQAIQPHLLEILGRIHTREDFAVGVGLAAAAGFASINADIMLGLPGQTLSDVAATVSFLLDLPVDHVSFYSLSLEEGTPLKSLCDKDPAMLPDEEIERAQYSLVRRMLLQAGFSHYEISNAARPGRQCRHNLVYWQALPYFGFGAAAHSLLQGIRRGNSDELDSYIRIWRSGGVDPFAAASVLETLDVEAVRKEVMMLGLRLLAGVRRSDFAARFGVGMDDVFHNEIARLSGRGLLIDDPAGVRLSEKGLDLANQVFMEFV